MKKVILLIVFCIDFIYTEAQWSQVSGYQSSYGSVLGVTKYQGNLWVNTTNGIYKITGSAWQLTSSGLIVTSGVGCIYTDGVDLYVGGLFNLGSERIIVLKWDGIQWLPIGYTDNNSSGVWVASILKSSTGRIYVGGFFNSIGTSSVTLNNIRLFASFDGVAWTQPYAFTDFSCAAGIESIQPILDSVYVAGLFSEVLGVWTPSTYRFKEGGAMSALGGYGFCELARDYQLFQNNLYVGGTREDEVTHLNVGLTKRVGNSWISAYSGLRIINTRTTKLLGKMYIAGVPNGGLNGVPTNIVSYDGSVFLNEGVGISSPNGSVYPSINTIFADTIENKLYVGGNFLQANGNTADNFAVKSFSIVPIRLSSFNVKLTSNNHVLLSWRDETPSDQNKFEIQMSIDGINFYKTSSVSGKANLYDYSFLYKASECGKLFFRLAFESKYSEIRSIELSCSGPKITAGKQSLNVDTKLSGQLLITNTQGQVVSKTVLHSGNNQLSLSVPVGIYFSRFIDEKGNCYSQKLFIQ